MYKHFQLIDYLPDDYQYHPHPVRSMQLEIRLGRRLAVRRLGMPA